MKPIPLGRYVRNSNLRSIHSSRSSTTFKNVGTRFGRSSLSTLSGRHYNNSKWSSTTSTVVSSLGDRLESSSKRNFSAVSAVDVLSAYDAHVAERAAMAGGTGVAPKPLDAQQVSDLTTALLDSSTSSEDAAKLVELLSHRVPPGVDEAAYVKASFLSSVAFGEKECEKLQIEFYESDLHNPENSQSKALDWIIIETDVLPAIIYIFVKTKKQKKTRMYGSHKIASRKH